MFVVRIRFVRSSETVNDDDEKEAEGSLSHFREQNEEQMSCSRDQFLKGDNFHLKNIKLQDIHERNVFVVTHKCDTAKKKLKGNFCRESGKIFFSVRLVYIEVREYGIYARVVEVSEIERMSAAYK